MADKQLLTALLHLKDPWYIERIDVDVAREEAHVTINHHPGPLPCPTCGVACPVEDHSDDRIIRHLDLWQAKTFIHVAMPRTRCSQHGVLRVVLPFAEPGSRFTMSFEERVIATILACQTVQGASELLRISWDEARGIMERAVARGLGRRTADIIPYLGVDEKAIRKGHRYVTVLTDLEGRRILEVTPERTTASLVDARKTLDSRQIAGVQAVSMDMWDPYRQAVREAFPVPQPDVVHDRFHLVSHANKALNDVRKDEARELAEAGRKDLKGLRQAILFGSENLPERHEPRIAALKASDLRTAKGYRSPIDPDTRDGGPAHPGRDAALQRCHSSSHSDSRSVRSQTGANDHGTPDFISSSSALKVGPGITLCHLDAPFPLERKWNTHPFGINTPREGNLSDLFPIDFS